MLGTQDDMLGTPDASGYTHFEVYPQPGALAWASLSLPTVRGTIELRFNQTTNAFDASLTIPTGSTARVCLPPLAAASAAAGKQPLHDEAGRQASGTLTGMGPWWTASSREECCAHRRRSRPERTRLFDEQHDQHGLAV